MSIFSLARTEGICKRPVIPSWLCCRLWLLPVFL